MANQEHLSILMQGVETWNEWRENNPDIAPDLCNRYLSVTDMSRANLSEANLRGADLHEANLRGADLRGADLSQANLSKANLFGANLSQANLSRADLSQARLFGAGLVKSYLREADLFGADLSKANLSQADLVGAKLQAAKMPQADLSEAILVGADLHEADLLGANLPKADLRRANLRKADLSRANLCEANLSEVYLHETNLHGTNLSRADLTQADFTYAILIQTDLSQAILSSCRIYGISAWDVKMNGTTQSDLIITPKNAAAITVDNLEIAQFVYMLLHNEKIRDVIDTIGKKAVLILGRFTEERKAVLDAMRDELRKRDYIPILFDFEKPASRDLTETVVTLAHLSRFVIADLTDPSSIPHELMSFVRDLPSVAVQPIVNQGKRPYAMFEHLQRYPWVLPVYEYETQEGLIAALPEQIIQPAEAKVEEIRPKAV